MWLTPLDVRPVADMSDDFLSYIVTHSSFWLFIVHVVLFEGSTCNTDVPLALGLYESVDGDIEFRAGLSDEPSECYVPILEVLILCAFGEHVGEVMTNFQFIQPSF